MNGLAEAIRAGDHKRTELAAHNLKGVLETLGSSRAHHLLRELEARAREGWPPDTVPSLEGLEHALAEVVVFFTSATWRDRL
jgi:HPt (histidine-containing phosphotransfer) domain-containing protein